MKKFVITVSQNGEPKGYVKSISYKNSTFQTTLSKQNARKFTEDEAQGEIDYLTALAFFDGYIFGYDFA